MSKSNASAKQRRAFISPPIQTQSNTITQSPIETSNGTSGLTLQQVISLFDRRIIHLESFVNESSQKVTLQEDMLTESSIDNLPEIIDEFNSRFELLAQEIGTMKDTLLKLQTYTMHINKTLLDERLFVNGNLATITTSSNDVIEPFQLEDPVIDSKDEIKETIETVINLVESQDNTIAAPINSYKKRVRG